VLPSFVQDLAVWLPTYHTSQLGLGLLLGEPIVDNIAALLAATGVAASLAALAYRSMRA
jgi:ABC-2 type transport system permease protein